jgi:uncharacterized membrane protein YtjA (UPF0391 family)
LIYYAVVFFVVTLVSLLLSCFLLAGSLSERVALGLAVTFLVFTLIAAALAFIGRSPT